MLAASLAGRHSSERDGHHGRAVLATVSVRRRFLTRMAYPEYGPVFFTGQPNAAIFFENNSDLSVSKVTVSDYPGNGIIANSTVGAS